jgi:hypothetical protein
MESNFAKGNAYILRVGVTVPRDADNIKSPPRASIVTYKQKAPLVKPALELVTTPTAWTGAGRRKIE